MPSKELSGKQKAWITKTLDSMDLDEKIGQLLCPENRNYTVDEWLSVLQDVPIGCAFFSFRPTDQAVTSILALQENARIPLLISSDLENGAGCLIDGATEFPRPAAIGAANNVELATEMGRITAHEGRAFGVNWTFSPVVDLSKNIHNPLTNLRSLGDDPDRVSRLAAAWISGMQASGEMAATAKHFPGDGMDTRDQHFCTTVNSCTVSEWKDTYGKVWETVIEAGVLTIMSGHISFPAYVGQENSPAAALPATIEPKLQTQLLRDELGFKGLIVSDAAPMIGLTSRISESEAVVENILSGSDVFLFADARADFARLKQAVEDGRLSLDRIEQSARRVLELKARLGLHEEVFGAPLQHEEIKNHRKVALDLTRRSITLLRSNEFTPISLKPGARVLTITVTYEDEKSDDSDGWLPKDESALDERWLRNVDDELRKRGFHVDHLDNPDYPEIFELAPKADCIFCNVALHPNESSGSIHLLHKMMKTFWKSFYIEYPNTVFTAFGSPYFLYSQPHIPSLYLAYGHNVAVQKAAVKVWLGEIPAEGRCPVKMPLVVKQ